MLEHAVGGEGEGLGGKALTAPAADLLRRAAPRRRIGRVELRRHDPERLARQASLQRAAGAIDDEHVVAFLDARRRKEDLSHDAQRNRRDREAPPRACRHAEEPRPRPEERAISAFTRVFRRAMASVSKGEGERPDACAPHRAGGHDHRGDDEQRVAEEIVDGEPERRDHQDERGELEPRRALRWRNLPRSRLGPVFCHSENLVISSCAGLTRASIPSQKLFAKMMDCRVKPGNDELNLEHPRGQPPRRCPAYS